MQLLLDALRAEPEYRAILDNCRAQKNERKPHPMVVTGLSEGARDSFFGAVITDLRALSPACPVLVLLPDEKELLRTQAALGEAGLRTLAYPLRDFNFHNITASRDYEHERLAVLCAVLENTCDAVLTTPDAALQYTMPMEVLTEKCLLLSLDKPCDFDGLTETLVDMGYSRCELVDGMGEFAVRGGILDIFPAFGEYPVRIDFFGDEIDQMGTFDPLTQRRLENCSSCMIPPAHEVLLSANDRKKLRTVIAAQRKKCGKDAGQTILDAELEALDSGVPAGFLDKYITVLYPSKTCLLDYFGKTLPDGTTGAVSPVLVQDTGACKERIAGSEYRMREAITTLLDDESVSPKYAEYTKWAADYEYFLTHSAALFCDAFTSGGAGQLSGIFTFRSKHTVSYAESYETLLEDVRQDVSLKYRSVLLTENALSAKNLHDSLFDEGITAVLSEKRDLPLSDVSEGVPVILSGVDLLGFELPESRFALRTTYPGDRSSYARALTQNVRRRKQKKSSAERILSYADLTVGDYVVHVNHGIGQYMGMEPVRSPIDNTVRDFIRIRYADNAALLVPCDQLDSVSKYIGARGEDGIVKLSKMGGTEWTKTKARVKAAAKEMAKDLIQLYAARMRRAGYAFAADDDMQRAFESVFPFEETDSQLSAIEEIKADMQKPVPMDRLLCGDVGYGKTEVALRAAMKAAENGKQTAILVPTTILALQHYQTILSRFRGLPVHAEILSRFRTPKQQEQILRKLKRGEIDIIVGTHRLISKDVQFRDLGLVVIDEEQRFGVAAKERLKQLSENVDCLTLTATPIPRTLNMAMSGIRDMSILDEAPGDRVPIQTYVLEYDEMILGDALKKELRRGGQVFWLHNRIEDIDSCSARVSQLVPDARIAVAHGKMDKEEISELWQRLLDGELDILISTTIIETGIDIPNANTLVIENADTMGLSQLHQIRGRIGRSSRRAYAYFTYPKGRILTEIASKRLQAIREYTEFGSGFKIAMRDLELRGAGNLLGAEQHGHMESVGYDLYIRLLNEAILEEKGIAAEKKTESVVDVSVDAYLPEHYIRSGAQRIDLYKKIGALETKADRSDILDEITDRYGDPPKACVNLIRVAYLRALASRCHVARVEIHETTAQLYPEQFSLPAWAETSLRLSEASSKEAKPAVPPVRRPAGAVRPMMTRSSAGVSSVSASSHAKLTVSAGVKPCITARLPKGKDSVASVTEVLECYEEVLSGKGSEKV